MGAWGAGSFENDDAMDWAYDFCEAPGRERIVGALTAVFRETEGYVEAPESSNAIAAAEIVAALKMVPGSTLPEDVRRCVDNSDIVVDPDLVDLALEAVSRVREDSELKELWDESEYADEWYAVVEDIEARLRRS
jgi:Domain of unknown function (DUF4259)